MIQLMFAELYILIIDKNGMWAIDKRYEGGGGGECSLRCIVCTGYEFIRTLHEFWIGKFGVS